MSALGVSAASLLIGYVFAGLLGVLGVVAYLGCILAPGAALYAILAGRFRSESSNLLEVVFYSNLLGFAMTEGGGWVLARSGWFSLPGLLGMEGIVLVCLTIAFWRPLRQRFYQSGGTLLPVTSEEIAFLGIVIASACLLLMPLLSLFSEGFFVGTDTPFYTRVGWLVATTGRWPALSQVLWPYASPAAMAPGAPMVYAVFSALTGSFSPPMATVIALVPVTLTPLGLCLLVRRFTTHPLLTYGLPLVWAVGTTDYGGLLYNNVLTTIYTGSHPDVTLGLPFLVAVFLLLTYLAQGKTSQWFEILLLSGAVLASTLASQLNFIFVVAALLFFGIGVVWTRGMRWSLIRLGIVLVPTLVAWPLYLIPSNLTSGSSGISNGSVWEPSAWQVNWSSLFDNAGVLTVVCAVIVTLAILAVLYERLRHHPIGSASSSSHGIVPFTGLGLLALYLAYSAVASTALGISVSRLLPFASVAFVPVIAFGIDRFFHIRLRKGIVVPGVAQRRTSVGLMLAAVGVAALLVYAGVSSLETGAGLESKSANPANLVTSNEFAASEWLKANAPSTAVIAIDANGGNVGAVYAIAAYSDHVSVTRFRTLLYDSLHLPPPQNTSFYYVNLVMTDPTAENAAAAASFGIDYYVFQNGFSNRQITAFSILPYFSLVYSNNQIDVFEYMGGSAVGFIPAVSYCSSSESIVTAYSALAYSFAASNPSLPKTPNWVTSTAGYPAGSLYATYCVNIPEAGNYTLYVDRDAFGVTQFINVSIGGPTLGQVYFLSRGLVLGTPLQLTLPAGLVDLRLSFQGGQGILNAVDYLALVPDPPA